MFRRIRSEFKYFQKRGRIPVLGRIRSEFQCFQKQGENSSVRKHKVRIPVFTKIGLKFQY